MRLFLKLLLLGVLVAPAQSQDRHDWKSLSRLHPGDRVRVVLKTEAVDGEFHSWTPEEATIGAVTARREDVLKIERYRHGGSRATHTAVGASIGFVGGFAVGASTGGCGNRTLGPGGSFGPCGTRLQLGAMVGGVGAVIGAIIGVLLPVHSKELIYSSSPRKRTSNRTVSEGGSIALIP